MLTKHQHLSNATGREERLAIRRREFEMVAVMNKIALLTGAR